MRFYRWSGKLTLLLSLALPQYASAHLVSSRFGEFYSGFLHPLTTLIHLLPWVAFGLLAGSQKLALTRSALFVFPSAVFMGVFLGANLPQWQVMEQLNLFTFLAAVLTLIAVSLDKKIFIAMLALFGLCHGYANGYVQLVGLQLFLYAAGVTLAAYILMIVIAAVSHLLISRQTWGMIAVRALSSWIVAIGLMYGGYLLFSAAA